MTGKKFEKKIWFYLMLISAMPVLVLGVVSYVFSIGYAAEQLDASNDSALLQTVQGMDFALENIKQYYGEAVNSKELKPLLESCGEKADYASVKTFESVMSGKRDFIHYITGYSLVNSKSGWVYSNQGIYRLANLSNKKELEQLLNSRREMATFWLNHIYDSWSADTPYIDLNSLSLIYRFPLVTEEKYSMLVINIDTNAVEQLLTTANNIGSMVIYDSNGKLLYEEQEGFGQSIMTQVSLLENGSSEEKGIVIRDKVKFQGKTWHISFTTSSESEWTYVSCYDMKLTQLGAWEILLPAVLITVIVMLLVILGSFLGTRRLYKPVQDTYESIQSLFQPQEAQVQDNDANDEFGYIEKGFSYLYTHNKELASRIQVQEEQLTELFLPRLIRGQLTREALLSELSLLHIVPKEWMSMIIMSIPRHRDGKRLSDAELDVMYLTVIESIPKEVQKYLVVMPVNYLHMLVFLTGTADRDALETAQQNVCRVMNRHIRQSFDCLLRTGISRPFHDLLELRQAYNEAVEALKVERQNTGAETLDGFERVTYYSDVAPDGMEANTYSVLLQNQMKEAVDKCDETQAFLAVDQFLGDIRQKGICLNEQQYFLHRFLVGILNVGADAGININEVYPDSTGSLFRQLDRLVSWEDISNFYKETVLRPLTDHLKGLRKNGRIVMLERIDQLIKEREGDITLTECAEALNCHANYIWRILKESRQQTFGDCAAQARIAKAKELLAHQELSVNEISERMNFTNAQNFIRYFKKHTDMTPGQYRKQLKE